MHSSIFRISLDVHEINSQVTLHVKKGDSARQILIALTEAGRPYRIAKDCMAVFTAKKPDETILYNGCEIQGNNILYSMTPQTCTAVGMMKCEIRLYGAGGALITSPCFSIIVDETVYSDGAVVDSSSEFTALTELMTQALDVIAQCEEWLENAEDYATSDDLRKLKSVVGDEAYLTLLKASSALEAVYALRMNVGDLSALETETNDNLVIVINELIRKFSDSSSQIMRAFSARAASAAEEEGLIAVPLIHNRDETADGMGLACVIRSEGEDEAPDPDGRVNIPTVRKVVDLIGEHAPDPGVSEDRVLELIRAEMVLDFSAMDEVIGGV